MMLNYLSLPVVFDYTFLYQKILDILPKPFLQRFLLELDGHRSHRPDHNLHNLIYVKNYHTQGVG